MGNLGDISKVMETKELADHKWLDIDPKEYKNIPMNKIPSYIAIPKLEEAWRHKKDVNLNLVPNSNLNFNYQIPQKSITGDVNNLIRLVKSQMMLGKHGKDLIDIIKSRTSSEVLKAAKEQLQKISEEHGLLGTVYIDTNVFPRCLEGAKFLDKKSKLAKFAKKNDKCANCSFNKKGRCEVYKKILVAEMKYDRPVLAFYSKHLSNLKGKDILIQSKEELKRCFLETEKVLVKQAEFKPVDSSLEKSLEDKQKEFQKQLEELKLDLSNVKQEKISKDISTILIKGYSSIAVKNYINQKYASEFKTDKKDFQEILKKQGSLGKVYAEAEYLPVNNCHDAKELFKKLPHDFIYLIIKPKDQFCKCDDKTKCHNLNKPVLSSVNEIPKKIWATEFNKYSKEIQQKLSNIFEKDPVTGLRLAFIQESLFKPQRVGSEFETFNLRTCINYQEPEVFNTKKVAFSSDKLVSALNKGYPLSSIFKTLKKLGAENKQIIENLSQAFTKVGSIKRYQLDVKMDVPKTVKVKMGQKDISKDIIKSSNNSVNAPIDNMLMDLNVQATELQVDLPKAKEDLKITGLKEFTF